MSNTELSNRQLLDIAKAALGEKDAERAKLLFAEFSKRSVARDKARVANDPG
jgi:DNA phosphorothioation-dependent restriction protein DptG